MNLEYETFELDYLPVKHEDLPVQVVFEIDGINYIFDFDYNERFDFYTITVKDEENNPVYSCKLTYLSDAFKTACEKVCKTRCLVPLELSDVARDIPEIERIDKDNFDSMRLCLI